MSSSPLLTYFNSLDTLNQHKMPEAYSLPVGDMIFGGYLMSLMLYTALKHKKLTKPIHQYTQFFRPCLKLETFHLNTTQVAKSKRFETLETTLSQQHCHLSSQLQICKNTQKHINYLFQQPAPLSDISNCQLFRHPKKDNQNFFKTLNIYLDPSCENIMNKQKDSLELKGWFQWPNKEPFDFIDLPFLCDAHPPLPYYKYGAELGWIATLNMSIQFKTFQPTAKLKFFASSKGISQNFLEEDVSIWTESNTCVAVSRQLAYIQSIE